MEFQESSRKAPAHHWSGLSKIRCIEWRQENQSNFTLITPAQVAQHIAKRDILGLQFPPQGKVRTCERKAGFYNSAWHCQRGPLFFLPPQNWGVLHNGLWEGRAGLRENQPELSESIKGIWILLTNLWSPSGSPSMSRWECLVCRSSQQSVKTGGGDYFFKCEDRNARLQDEKSGKLPWHHRTKTIILQ